MTNYSWNTAIITKATKPHPRAFCQIQVLVPRRQLPRTWTPRAQAMTTCYKMSLRTVHVFGPWKTVTNHFSKLITRTSLRSAVRVHNSVSTAKSNIDKWHTPNTSSSIRSSRLRSKWTTTTKTKYRQTSNNGLLSEKRSLTFDIDQTLFKTIF